MGRMVLIMRMAPLCGGVLSAGFGALVGEGRESERMKWPATRERAWVSEW